MFLCGVKCTKGQQNLIRCKWMVVRWKLFRWANQVFVEGCKMVLHVFDKHCTFSDSTLLLLPPLDTQNCSHSVANVSRIPECLIFMCISLITRSEKRCFDSSKISFLIDSGIVALLILPWHLSMCWSSMTKPNWTTKIGGLELGLLLRYSNSLSNDDNWTVLIHRDSVGGECDWFSKHFAFLRFQINHSTLAVIRSNCARLLKELHWIILSRLTTGALCCSLLKTRKGISNSWRILYDFFHHRIRDILGYRIHRPTFFSLNEKFRTVAPYFRFHEFLSCLCHN